MCRTRALHFLRKSRDNAPGLSSVYRERVNRAIDVILQNLDQPLPLEVVAKAAGFSSYHFHRIFRQLTGESLHVFVKRVRLERALILMSRKDRAGRRVRSLTDVAFACGFGSPADFSRSFRQHYGAAPSRFDLDAFRALRRKEWQQIIAQPGKSHRFDRLQPHANPDGFAVKLRRLPPRVVAYVRVADPYGSGRVLRAVETLTRWAEPRGLADGQWLGYMWDDPEIVPHEKCRYDVGLEVPAMRATGDIGRIEFPAMQVAEVQLRGGAELELRALDWLFGTWLPASGYLPTEQPCFEAWDGRPFAHGQEHFELRIQIPVRRG